MRWKWQELEMNQVNEWIIFFFIIFFCVPTAHIFLFLEWRQVICGISLFSGYKIRIHGSIAPSSPQNRCLVSHGLLFCVSSRRHTLPSTKTGTHLLWHHHGRSLRRRFGTGCRIVLYDNDRFARCHEVKQRRERHSSCCWNAFRDWKWKALFDFVLGSLIIHQDGIMATFCWWGWNEENKKRTKLSRPKVNLKSLGCEHSHDFLKHFHYWSSFKSTEINGLPKSDLLKSQQIPIGYPSLSIRTKVGPFIINADPAQPAIDFLSMSTTKLQGIITPISWVHYHTVPLSVFWFDGTGFLQKPG